MTGTYFGGRSRASFISLPEERKRGILGVAERTLLYFLIPMEILGLN